MAFRTEPSVEAGGLQPPGCVALASGCGITRRSRRPPAAGHLGRQASLPIIRLAAQAPSRWWRLTSNVRPRVAAATHAKTEKSKARRPSALRFCRVKCFLVLHRKSAPCRQGIEGQFHKQPRCVASACFGKVVQRGSKTPRQRSGGFPYQTLPAKRSISWLCQLRRDTLRRFGHEVQRS